MIVYVLTLPGAGAVFDFPTVPGKVVALTPDSLPLARMLSKDVELYPPPNFPFDPYTNGDLVQEMMENTLVCFVPRGKHYHAVIEGVLDKIRTREMRSDQLSPVFGARIQGYGRLDPCSYPVCAPHTRETFTVVEFMKNAYLVLTDENGKFPLGCSEHVKEIPFNHAQFKKGNWVSVGALETIPPTLKKWLDSKVVFPNGTVFKEDGWNYLLGYKRRNVAFLIDNKYQDPFTKKVFDKPPTTKHYGLEDGKFTENVDSKDPILFRGKVEEWCDWHVHCKKEGSNVSNLLLLKLYVENRDMYTKRMESRKHVETHTNKMKTGMIPRPLASVVPKKPSGHLHGDEGIAHLKQVGEDNAKLMNEHKRKQSVLKLKP